jgi:hypothetical protein
MRAVPFFLMWAICAPAADQPADPVTCTVTRDPTGAATVKVHNAAASAVTAFSFIYTLHRDPAGATYGATTAFYDSLTDPQMAHAIPPGGDIILPFRIGGNGMYAKVSIAAGIFADGTTFGERVTVQKILDRRNFMLVSLNKSIGDLNQAMKDRQTREQIAAQFQMALNMEMGAGLDPELNSCIQSVRGFVLGMLRAARAPDGTAPPTEMLVQSILQQLKARQELLKNP